MVEKCREDEFDLDLEDMMVMEAIWLSIQENGRRRRAILSETASSQQYIAEDHSSSAVTDPVSGSSSSPSGGLACAIAALAERQQTGGETSSYHGADMSAYNILPGCNGFPNTQHESQNVGSSIDASPDIQLAMTRGEDNRSEMADAGTSYAGSEEVDNDVAPTAFQSQDASDGVFHPIAGQIVPESFEEEMMLGMAVSLAEARARTNAPEVAWQ